MRCVRPIRRPRKRARLCAAALALSAVVIAIASAGAADSRRVWCATTIPSITTASGSCGMAPGVAAQDAVFDPRAAPAKAQTPPSSAPAAAAVAATGGAAAAAETAVAAATPLKPFSIVADPGDLVASRMARDFVKVVNDHGAQGPRDRRLDRADRRC